MAGNIFDDTIEQLPKTPAPGEPPADDPYGAAANQVIARRLDEQRTAIGRAVDTTPDVAADVLSLSKRYGLAPSVVERNFKTIQKRARLEDVPAERLLKDAPALSDFLSEPYRAAAVSDDIEPLAALEKAVRVTGNSVRALAAGVSDFNVGFWGVAQQVGEASGIDALTKFAKYGRAENIANADFARGAQEGAGELEKAFYSGFESLGLMVPGTLASLATGTPGPMLAVMGGTTEGEAYGRARDRGKTVGEATTFGMIQGAIEVATEMIPAKLFLKDLATNAPFRAMVLHQLKSELPGEEIATALQDLNEEMTLGLEDLDEWASLNPDGPLADYLKERPGAAVQTLVATITSVGAMTVTAGAMQRMAGDSGKAERAEQSKGFFDAVAGAVGSMKTAEKFPESIERVVNGAAADSGIEKLYMPIDTFTTYWQSKGEDPAARAAELTGNPNAYTQALKTGADLPIPVAAYAAKIANTDHNAYFVEELRLGPDEMNRRESAAFKEQQTAEATLAREEAAAPETSPTEPIRQELQQQFEGAGVEKSTAAAYVDLAESTFGKMAGLIDADPVEFYARYGVTVERPELAAPEPKVAAPAPMPTQAPIPIETPAAAPAVDPAHAKAAAHAERYAPYIDVLEEFPAIDVATQGPREVAKVYFDELYGENQPGTAALLDAVITATSKIAKTKGDQKVAILDWIRENEKRRLAFEQEQADKQPGVGYNPNSPELKAARRFAGVPEPVATVDDTGRDLGGFAGPERRSAERGVAPGGVERRNEPAGLQPGFERGAVGALAARYRSENPNIMRDAEAMRARASEAGRIEEPAELKAKRKGAVLDKNAAEAQTIQETEDASTEQATNRIADQSRSPADGRIAASDPGNGKTGKRAETHFARVFAAVFNSAREIDPAVDEVRLREEFDFRVALILDQQHLAANEGHSPHELLREIAKLGGLYEEDNGMGLYAELKALGAGGPFGALAGVRGVFAAKKGYRTRNQTVRGHGVDVMLQKLQSDPRFSWIESPEMLLDAIDEVSRQGAEKYEVMLPGTEELRDAGIRREKRWWPDGWAAGDMLADVDESIIAGAEGDTSFNVKEFNQSLFDEFDALEDPQGVDTLATGEQQPRLPEAGAVRDTEVATPEIAELPFSLTSEIAKPGKKNAGQKTLFQSEGVTNASVETWAAETKLKAGDDVKAFDVHLTTAGDLVLDALIVARGAQRAGLGSKLMTELTRFADANGLRVVLSPAERGYQEGTTSYSRLVKFYQRFGFVRNAGRHARQELLQGMYREPNALAREMNQGEDDGTKRGAIRFGPDRQMSIVLLQKADLSTALHEFGHLFLEVFGDVNDTLQAKDPATLNPEQAKALADYNALLAWLGVAGRGEIQDEHHEKFARGFEAYLMEGRAPSVELRSSFARYRAWLLGIYKSLKGLKVNLSDDVRRVFDRMVATDQAIAEARAQAQIVPMFTTAESAGMEPERFELYRKAIADEVTAARERLEVKLLAEVRREQEATWKAQREEIHTAVETETHSMPVYIAMAAIQRGTKPDGSAIVEGMDAEPMKLSRKMIVDRFGADRLKRLPRPYVYTKDGGLDPEAIAPMFGFTSADEMLQAIEAAEPMARRIERETDRRMLAAHGSMLLDGTLPEQAQAAMANDQREMIVREELRALGRLRRQVSPFVRQATKAVAAEKNAKIDALAGEVSDLKAKARGGPATITAAIPPDDVVREAAKLTVAGMRVRDIRPSVYWVAARRAGQKAIAAAARQDFDTAITEKQHELMSLAVYREANAVLDDVQSRVQRAIDLAKPAAQARLGKAGDSYRDQVNQILDQYDFSRQTGKALDRRESLRGWVAALQAQGLAVEIPEDVLDDARRIAYRDLTTEELIGITDALEHIVHLSRLKNRLLKNQDERDFEVKRDRLVASIRANNDEHKLPVAFRRRDRVARKFREWFASHARIATLAQLMDGREDGGEMWSSFVRPANEAATEEQTRFAQASKEFAAIMRAHYPGTSMNRLHDKLHIPEIADSLTLDERLAVARNWGNETSRDRMVNDPRRKWNEAQIRAILDTLDKNDLSFVQATFDYINKFWPEIAAKQKRVTGLEPEKVQPVEIVTKNGTIPGGYFPLVADSRYNARTKQWEKLAEAELKTTAAYVASTTKRGHVKNRQKHARYTVKLEGGVVFAHLEQVIHDLTHHEMLIDTTRLLRDPKVSEAIYDTAGDLVYDQFAGALEAVAAGKRDGARNMIDEAAQFIKTRVQVAMLGYNLWTGLQQPLGLFNGADRVGAKWVARGMFRWLTSPLRMERTVKWIHEVSPFMANRSGNATQDLADLRRAFSQPGGWFDTMIRTVSRDAVTQQHLLDSMLWHIGLMQRVADVPTWLGQYEKSRAAGETDERAIALADQAIIDSQGSGRIVDLAQVQRGGPVAQLYMTFYSYGNTTFNAAYRRAGRTDFKKPIQVTQFLGGLSLIYILPAMGTVLLSHMAGRSGGDDDEPEDFFNEVGSESLASVLNSMAVIREFSGFAAKEPRGYAGPAGARLIVMMNQFLEQAKQGELDDDLIKKGLSVGGAVFGLPAAQMQRTLDGWRAWEEDEAGPAALLFGPPKN